LFFCIQFSPRSLDCYFFYWFFFNFFPRHLISFDLYIKFSHYFFYYYFFILDIFIVFFYFNHLVFLLI
jgi:hypothetical protein